MPVMRALIDKSGRPLIRFTGHAHDLQLDVPSLADPGLVDSLNLIISVGNEDLRGGGSAGDNCDVVVGLANGATVRVGNANGGGSWQNWTDHTVRIPIAAGSVRASDIKFVSLQTGFGGGIGGDNWNVQRVQLLAWGDGEGDPCGLGDGRTRGQVVRHAYVGGLCGKDSKLSSSAPSMFVARYGCVVSR